MLKIILKLFLIIFFGFTFQLFAQVESTTSGGSWTSPGTWKDGVVPAPGDNVLIKGPVTLDLITFANSIEITNTGGLAPEIITGTTYKLYIANYLWNNGIINGYNLEIYIGGSQAGSIYNTANGTWNSGNLYVVDTLSHPFLSEGIWFSPASIKADSATLVSAGNIEIDSTTLYARKIILGQNLQNEAMVMDHGSILRVENFTYLSGDTSGIEFKNNSYISSSPISGTASSFTNVIFKGDVGIGSNVFFYGNTILNGNIYPQFFSNYKITSSGLFQNNGEIKPASSWKLLFDIYGDLVSNGNWSSSTIRMMGTGNHIVLTDPNFTFSPSNFTALTSTVTISTSPPGKNGSLKSSGSFLRFDESTVQIMKIIIETGSSLNLVSNSSLAVNELIGNGNEVKFINNSYLSKYSAFGNSSFENVNFTGNVGVGADLNFNGSCYLNGTMYPQFFSNYTITSTGLFQNNGEIKPSSSWKLYFNINGNLTNNGPWNTNTIRLLGNSNHNLQTDTSYSFAPDNFQSDSSTVLSNSDLRFDNSIIRIKDLSLQNSNSLKLNNSRFAGTIMGNGNVIYMNNSSYFTSHSVVGTTTLENVNFTGNVGVGADLNFNGSCYLNGTMYPQFFSNYKITSSGLFQNNGEIKPSSSWKLFLDIKNDIENTGSWIAAETRIIGDFNQHLGIQDTASINKIKIDANRSGDSYQWTLNGSPFTNGGDISGATSSTLIINNFNSNYFGTIKCEIDSAGNSITSRDIVVNDIITEVEINADGNGDGGKDGNKNQIPKIFSLSQNYPNPFNPSTIIEYSIPVVETRHALSVQLRIFDILGREVAVLVNEHQKPGYYKINFDASSLSSGIYFYRISAGKFVSVKKMILLR